TWTLPPDSVDAVIATNLYLVPAEVEKSASAERNLSPLPKHGEGPGVGFLTSALQALRPGGRLIILDSDGQPGHRLVAPVESAGYTRILVEPLSEEGGVLMRGEKPHTTPDTLERIRQVAGRDGDSDLSTYSGRYVHLLIQQIPNKPAWKLQPDEKIEWRAL